MSHFRSNLSKYSILFVLLVVSIIIISAKHWRKSDKVIAMDVVSYYAYLPATFIFNDIKLEKRETFDNGLFWPEPLDDGHQVIKTSMGMSMLYSPFFFISHGIAKLTGDKANGFTTIYKVGLLLSSVFDWALH